MNKYLLLFYLSIVGMSFRQRAMAQSADLAAYVTEVTIPSAGTAGLMKFTDVPVSYYTGTPDISVPIYTISTGKLSLPIILRYSGAANRVADNSSNVGLGWTLSAEGVLQESVLGIPDNNTYHQYGLDWEGGMLNPSSQTHQQLLESLVTGGLDGVPDLYTFSFPGGSGKFIYADVIRTLPQQNLAITTYINGTEPDWKIVTQDGTQYYFEIMEKIANRASSSVTRSRAWYLTKMVDANNTDSILLSYEPTMITESIGRSYNFTTWRPNAPVLAPFDIDMAPNDPPIPGQFDHIEQMTHGWQLKTITWNQGSIEYDIAWNDRQDMAAGNSDGGLPRIRNIFLKNKEGATIRVVNFKHAYFETPGEDNINGKRLKLESVTFASSLSNLSTPEAYNYAFEYDPRPLPIKGSNSVDHWGFYNGAANASKGLIPSISYPGFNYYGANREANPAYGKAAMLTKMYYPTGGYAAFTWEGHAKTYAPQFDSVIVYTDTTISMALACVGNEEITAEWEDRITIPTTPTDLFGNGVQATWYCSMGTSGQNTMLTVNHAGGAGWLLERPAIQPAAAPVTTTSKSFPYSPTGNYHHQQNVTLQPGKMYSIKGHINHPGFSLDVSLEAKWPKKIWTSTTQPSEFVGGMRIKKIEMFDTVTRKSIVRHYQYAQPSFAAKPRYYSPLVRYYFFNGSNPPEGSATDCMYYQASEGLFVSSSSVYNVNGGVQAGYSWVKETIGDGQDGYTTYYFNNFSDGTFLGEVPATWRFGRLERKSEYNPAGNEIRRTTYSNKTILTSAEDFAGHTAQQIAAHPCYSPGGVYGANYTQKAYRFPCDWLYTDTVKTDDFQTGLSTLSISNYDNAQHRELTRSTTFLSDGTKQTSFIKYPTDFSFSNSPSGDAAAIARMQEKHMHNIAIEQYVQRWAPGSSQATTLAAGYNQFQLANPPANDVVPAVVHKMDIAVPLTNFQPATASTNVMVKDSRYTPKTWVEEQDSRYNPLTLASDGNDNAGYIWGYGNTLPIAKVKNDSTNRYRAFTSFEQDAPGNWNYNESSVTLSDRLTGKRAFQLTQSNDVSIMVSVAIGGTQAAPPIPGNYVLSYWRKGGTTMVNGITPIVIGATSNGWTYCEHRLPNPNGVLTLSGTAMIDELRFYQIGAQMESFTYDPLFGITSADNAAGQLLFYEYDAMGRLSVEKDVFGKILKKYTYQYSGQ